MTDVSGCVRCPEYSRDLAIKDRDIEAVEKACRGTEDWRLSPRTIDHHDRDNCRISACRDRQEGIPGLLADDTASGIPIICF